MATESPDPQRSAQRPFRVVRTQQTPVSTQETDETLTPAEVERNGIAGIPFVPWSQFLDVFNWVQGEHITAIGPTGWGKSTLIREILHRRSYVVAFATKRRDATMDEFEDMGYKVQKRFRPEVEDHIILKPPIDPNNIKAQAPEFRRAMATIYWMGGWCVDFDEAVALSRDMGLESNMNFLWMQGRSLGISIVAATQRPAYLPMYGYDMPTHFFFWKLKLTNDVRRVAALGGLDLSQMMNVIRRLPKYYALYYNKETDLTLITTPEV